MTFYTYELVDKKLDFPTFAMTCARAIDHLMSLRDHVGPIPDVIEPGAYHKTAAEEARRKVAQLEAMTDAQQLAFGEAEKARQVDAQRKSIAATEAENATMLAMVEKVEAWAPPTPEHESLKRFMLEQLRTSIHPSVSFENDQLKAVQARPAEDYHPEHLRLARQAVDNHNRDYAKAVERAAKSTEWLRKLRDSLATATA